MENNENMNLDYVFGLITVKSLLNNRKSMFKLCAVCPWGFNLTILKMSPELVA